MERPIACQAVLANPFLIQAMITPAKYTNPAKTNVITEVAAIVPNRYS
jgi:hypothetical protein